MRLFIENGLEIVLQIQGMDDRLKDLKKLYKEMATGKPNDRYFAEVAKEVEERLNEREKDLTTPHTCDAAYIYHPAGASLDEIESFTAELTQVVDKMKEELVNEKRILEGTDVPEYKENELTPVQISEEQWKNALQTGCLITDPTLTSTLESDTLSDFARLSSLDSPSGFLPDSCEILFRNSCSAKSDDCGTETGAMNESSECTVPMISEPMDGMQSETK